MACTGTVLGAIWPLSLLGDIWAWLAAKHFGSKREIACSGPANPILSLLLYTIFILPEEINI